MALIPAYRDEGETMGQPRTPHQDTTTGHAVGPLGTLHDRQRRWHPVGRVAWWAFLLPLAIFAWSSWRLRGALRVGGYVLAGWVLLFGLAVVSAPSTPQTAAVAAPSTVAPAATTPALTTPTVPSPLAPPVAVAPVAEYVAPVAAPAPTARAARPTVPPAHTVRLAAPKPVRPKPAPARPVAPAPAAGNAYGDTYTNVDGNQVQRGVAAATRPAGATAQCKDGTWSFSQHRSGTCSGHGGIK